MIGIQLENEIKSLPTCLVSTLIDDLYDYADTLGDETKGGMKAIHLAELLCFELQDRPDA